MAVDWSLFKAPDMGNALQQGLTYGNALADQKYQRERDVVQDQRQARHDDMQEQRYGAETKRHEAAERAERFKMVARAVQSVPADQRPQAYEKMAPVLQGLGWTPEQIQMGGTALDDQSLALFVDKVDEELKIFEGPDGVYAVNPRTGKGERTVEFPRQPKGQWMERTVDADGRTELVWVEEPGAAGPSAAPEPGTATHDTTGNAVPPPPAPPSEPAPDIKTGVAGLTKIGVRVTSNRRTPERNRAVGGAANSYHLTGEAYDLVPPAGMSMEQLAAQARQAIPGAQVINEGDHVHIEPARRQGRGGSQPYQVAQVGGTPPPPTGGRAMAWDAPKPAKREAAPSGYRWTADGRQEFIPGGPADPATKARQARPIPGPVVRGYNENVSGLNKVRSAISLVSRDRDAFGLKNYAGDAIMQRADPKGVKVRALVADIGSLKIHDRSGAAVSAKEFPRLKPFVPSATDTAEAIITKLQNFEAELSAMVEETEGYYNEDSGYRPLERRGPAAQVPTQPRPQQPPRPAAPAAPKAGHVEGGYRFKGGDPANPRNWTKL